jgi:NAD(P)-dependent dehydrogenase (short-subunit alcohol dehydrogenase family)
VRGSGGIDDEGGDMDGRVTLVAGASSGIGRGTALMMAARGARVMAVARRADRLRDMADESGIAFHPVSLASESGCREAVEATRAAHGPIAILVVAAGIGSAAEASVWQEDPAVWDETMRVNLDAPFHLIRLAAADMVAAGWGRIVVVSSTAGVAGDAGMPAYCASKHGVIGLVRAAALDLAPHGVTCNAVLPGWVRTEMAERSAAATAAAREISVEEVWRERERAYAAGRIPTIDEVAESICWLCSDAASGVSGETVAVTLGNAW